MCEPSDDWPCKFDASPKLEQGVDVKSGQSIDGAANSLRTHDKVDKDFSFPCEPSVSEDDDEVTESKIKAFLDEKVLICIYTFCHFQALSLPFLHATMSSVLE